MRGIDERGSPPLNREPRTTAFSVFHDGMNSKQKSNRSNQPTTSNDEVMKWIHWRTCDAVGAKRKQRLSHSNDDDNNDDDNDDKRVSSEYTTKTTPATKTDTSTDPLQSNESNDCILKQINNK